MFQTNSFAKNGNENGNRNTGKLIILLTVGVGIVLVLVLLLSRGMTVEDILAHIPSHVPLAILVFLLLFALKTITIFVPMNLLYLAAAAIFPPVMAILVSFSGVIVSMSIGYIGGKKLGQEGAEKLFKKNPKLEAFVEKRKDNVTALCSLGRLSPVHFDPFSMLCGAMNLPFLKYIGASLLGVAPKLIPVVLFGYGLISLVQNAWL